MELNKENLERCYLIERLSTRKCADIFKISQSSIRSSMKNWEIKGRSYKENIMPNPKGSHLSDSHKEKISLHHKNDKNWHMRGRSGELHHNYSQEERKCAWCGEKMHRMKSYSRIKNTFCSKNCRAEWSKENLTGKNNPSFTSIEVECSWCGKKIIRNMATIAKNNNFFCCRKHCGLWKAQNLRGDKIYNWKGGYMPYYGENWLSQRRLALKRDNYTCQKCGKTKDDLEKNPDVHHKKSFRKFGLENYIQANDLKNLICLCGKCHSRIHNKSK